MIHGGIDCCCVWLSLQPLPHFSLVANPTRLFQLNIGARHAKASHHPGSVIDKHCSLARSPWSPYDPYGHDIEVATVRHRTPFPSVLHGGSKGWTRIIPYDACLPRIASLVFTIPHGVLPLRETLAGHQGCRRRKSNIEGSEVRRRAQARLGRAHSEVCSLRRLPALKENLHQDLAAIVLRTVSTELGPRVRGVEVGRLLMGMEKR